MTPDDLEPDEFFELMGNAVRRKIISSLAARPMSIKELGDIIDVSRQAILKQLKDLEDKGVIETKETEKQQGKKGPIPNQYTIKEYFTMHFEMNPSFTSPRITRLRFLSGDVFPSLVSARQKTSKDIKTLFAELAAVDAEVSQLTDKQRRAYALKNELTRGARETIESFNMNNEEKEVLYLLLRNPVLALDGFHAGQIIDQINFRKDILPVVLSSLVKERVLVQRVDGRYYLP